MALGASFMGDGAKASPDQAQSVLQQVANRYQAAPVNAHIDPVWQLIPALNGARLDRKRTLARWNKKDPQASLLTFEQLPPTIATETMIAPIYRGHPSKRQMALMFNVAWGEEYLPKILATLKQRQVKATFFIDGKWAAVHQKELRDVVDAGMELGNHGYGHRLFGRLTKAQMHTDIAKTNAIVHAKVGVAPVLFAPPAGDYNATSVQVAAQLGMKTVLWTVDTIDWKRPPSEVITARVVKKKTPGALVLMHPTAPTAKALAALIENLQKDGYRLVSVSDLISPTRPLPKTVKEALVGLRSQP